ncbi:hypothetical protein MUK42_28980 [Musa troglodytarum]|uniref:Uncharacterized protein n=1 Tax=Musa troglodytarum TaxID=320322 RepID=A0A9E7FIX2_9LILI|nr:hypothetical protein MUK42_28980 [Musa troglodytarum]
MLNFQQYASPQLSRFPIDAFAGEEWCFEQGTTSKRDPRGSARRTTTVDSKQAREQREIEKNLVKVRNEWMKVKEEMGFVKQRGELLSETLMATDRKVGVMLVELERAEKYVRCLMGQNDRLLEGNAVVNALDYSQSQQKDCLRPMAMFRDRHVNHHPATCPHTL